MVHYLLPKDTLLKTYWTHGHSVSSQALYQDNKSQSFNPENKLLYEEKKIQLLFFRNNV